MKLAIISDIHFPVDISQRTNLYSTCGYTDKFYSALTYELNNLWNNKEFNDIRHEMVDKILHESLKALSRHPKRIAGS